LLAEPNLLTVFIGGQGRRFNKRPIHHGGSEGTEGNEKTNVSRTDLRQNGSRSSPTAQKTEPLVTGVTAVPRSGWCNG